MIRALSSSIPWLGSVSSCLCHASSSSNSSNSGNSNSNGSGNGNGSGSSNSNASGKGNGSGSSNSSSDVNNDKLGDCFQTVPEEAVGRFMPMVISVRSFKLATARPRIATPYNPNAW